MIKFTPIRGTVDILPEEIVYWQKVENCAKTILKLANYEEIRTPIIEYTDLFIRTIGKNTDIVNKEMYNFQDLSNRNITLRPEGTAGVMRAYIYNNMANSKKNIHKLWYCGPMFRYERPQMGRKRQFHQFGIEVIGSSDVRAEVEIIMIVHDILKELNIDNLELHVNSIGNILDRSNYEKILTQYLLKYIADLDDDSKKRIYTNPIRILDSKNYKTQQILSTGPNIRDYLSNNSKEQFTEFLKYLESLDINYVINDKLVRGLDYYTNTAFEIKITNNESSESTICGGGRYDMLGTELSDNFIPAVGCAIGIERLVNILSKNNNKNIENCDFYIAANGQFALSKSLKVARILRQYKFVTNLDLSKSKFSHQIKKAKDINAKACIFIGDEEYINECLLIKWLDTFKQENISDNDLIKYLKNLRNK
uniref:histidine--tRNA ligase n=1 Tax=Cyanidium sp. THAL103 TaxID=3027999 RepID=A0A9Y1I466_9RHOD|nr:histidine--tRNA ligase [Cyanidium sp. THAL103]